MSIGLMRHYGAGWLIASVGEGVFGYRGKAGARAFKRCRTTVEQDD